MSKIQTQDLFETETCSRCDGEGRYSWNQIDGSRCYGCNGRGWRLTKRGAAARDAWVAEFTVTKKAQDVVAGDKVMVAGLGRRESLHVVASSAADELNPGQNRWNLKFESGVLGGLGTFIDSEVRLPASADDKRAAYERIAHMPGALGWPER